MKQTRRTKRVSGLIRQKLGHIIATEINDPELGIITVTRVDVSIDLKIARAFFSIVGGKKPRKKQINIIKGLSKLLRQKLAREVELKYMPELELVFDRTTQKAQRIEDLLQKARKKKNET
ncbi:MAG: 30S ribosome-binding factor RbfA [Elusimicrobiota bacterium]|nr:30S ribosome-binding factor RbfA [Elusimicrobiota bacterium]